MAASRRRALALSRELRLQRTPDLQRRRWIVGLSPLGASVAQIVAAYQTGLLRRLPDPPGRIWDSSRVDASAYAYKRMATPDGLMMVATYAVTAILAGAGGANRAARTPFLPIALFAKTIYDAVTCVKLARDEWKENEALCAYCQAATAVSVASVVLAAPEALAATRTLTH